MSPPAGKPPSGTAPTVWIAAIGSGVAVLLASAPVTAVVQGSGWLRHAVAVAVLVAAAGMLVHHLGALAVATGQCATVVVFLTAVFTEDGVLGVLPGPGAWREFGALIAGAGQQIATGIAPVPATPQILFLVTAAVGLLAVGVHLAAVNTAAPAAAGVPLLAVFAVPAALADELLPWWALAAAAAGFGLLLLVGDGARRQFGSGAILVAGAVVLALGIGAGAGVVGTAGRFDGGTGGSNSSIGLSPFTALRGQLEQASPVELLRVRGLRQVSYLRALTLSEYVPDTGWQATRPAPGVPLPGPIRPEPPAVSGDLVDVQVENVSFRDYWLPLYGRPVEVTGLAESRWVYDPSTGTAYAGRPQQEDSWEQRTRLSVPSVTQLRQANGATGAGPEYLRTVGVDPRVGALAVEVVAGRDTSFDRALALQEFFTGAGSPFRYSLQTAPGGGDDALVEFLTSGRVGYCEQFASAMAVMLRTVGIPARVAVGFTAGSDAGGYRSISTSDAHAWVEAWFPGVGWTTFDPTPLTDGRTITPPYVLEASTETSGSDAVDDGLPLSQPAEPEPTPAPAAADQSGPDAAGSSPTEGDGLPGWPFAIVALTAVAASVPAALRAYRRRRRLTAAGSGGPGAAAAGWAELLAESADRGTSIPPSDTVRGAARRLVCEHRLDARSQQALREVVGAVESSWYGGAHPDAGELDGPVRAVRTGIVAGSAISPWKRLLPRSVTRWPGAVNRRAIPARTSDGSAPPCGR